MNTFSDPGFTKERHQIETARQERNTASEAALVELGKVSNTQGGWLGIKTDVGMGFLTY
jgi:hypothetical protein